MKPADMIRWTLEWSNPYTNPPDGQPRVLLEEILSRGQEPQEIKKQHILGSPYGVHFRPMATKQPRQLSIEAKQGIRQQSCGKAQTQHWCQEPQSSPHPTR